MSQFPHERHDGPHVGLIRGEVQYTEIRKPKMGFVNVLRYDLPVRQNLSQVARLVQVRARDRQCGPVCFERKETVRLLSIAGVLQPEQSIRHDLDVSPMRVSSARKRIRD